MSSVPVKFLGCCAADFLACSSSIELSGITSRGLFLRTQANEVIFVSCEKHRSPVTANLPGDAITELQRVQNGERVTFTGNSICFDECGLQLATGSATVWQPPRQPQIHGAKRDFTRRLDALCSFCVAQQPGGFTALLAVRQGSLSVEELLPEAALANERYHAFYENLQCENWREAAVSLEQLLGMGRGLTPSGDDFAEGLLLLLNRWQHVLHPAFDVAWFNERVVSAARNRTTALSATLIGCAASGGADERLLAAADFIFCDEGSTEEMARGLLGLGNSSGVDALCGMAAALDICLHV